MNRLEVLMLLMVILQFVLVLGFVGGVIFVGVSISNLAKNLGESVGQGVVQEGANLMQDVWSSLRPEEGDGLTES